MRLHRKTIEALAELICGGGSSSGFGGREYGDKNFPYRSSSYLTAFFCEDCDLNYVHGGETRKWWVVGVLNELNEEPISDPRLPSGPISRVIKALMDPSNFEAEEHDRTSALMKIEAVLSRDGIVPFLGEDNVCYLTTKEGAISNKPVIAGRRIWSKEEIRKRDQFSTFLASASEDEFTERFLAPLFKQLGFDRISLSGHKDKLLEYGIDLWMKYRLPTAHFMYLAVQVKKGKIDASASGKNENVASVLNQAKMMIGKPIFDPENNREHLLDHAYIISSGEITKSARNFIGRQLDQEMRRHIIFMDREELLELAVDAAVPLRPEEQDVSESTALETEISF